MSVSSYLHYFAASFPRCVVCMCALAPSGRLRLDLNMIVNMTYLFREITRTTSRVPHYIVTFDKKFSKRSATQEGGQGKRIKKASLFAR